MQGIDSMNLLLLTKFYPYGTGEAFIENEIEIMAKYYDSIIIIACEVPEGEESVRILPRNAKAYKIPYISKSVDVIHSFFNKKIYNSDLKNEREKCSSLVQKLFLNYFEEKSQRIYKSIIENGFIDILTLKPYIIYSYWFFTTARVGILIAKYNNPYKLITRAHGYDLYTYRNPIKYLPYRTLFLNKYNMILPCSNNGTKYLRKLYPELSNNVNTAFLGTKDCGIGKSSSDGVFRIISCSRVEPVKRLEKLVDALSVLDNDSLQIEWIHVGDGSRYDKLKKYTKSKLKNIKTLFYGNMKNQDVMELYATKPFDLFLNVSSSEGLPVSIMEALSFGIPCVATDVGGTSEIVIDGITGKLIPSDFNDSELASIIKNFINHGDLYVKREACRKYWEEHFQAITNYKQLHESLQEKID